MCAWTRYGHAHPPSLWHMGMGMSMLPCWCHTCICWWLKLNAGCGPDHCQCVNIWSYCTLLAYSTHNHGNHNNCAIIVHEQYCQKDFTLAFLMVLSQDLTPVPYVLIKERLHTGCYRVLKVSKMKLHFVFSVFCFLLCCYQLPTGELGMLSCICTTKIHSSCLFCSSWRGTWHQQ